MRPVEIFALCALLLFTAAGGCESSEGAEGPEGVQAAAAGVAAGQLALPEGEDALADDRAQPRARPDLGPLAALLELSGDQVAQLQAITQTTRDALRDIRQQVRDGSLQPVEATAQARALRDEDRGLIGAVLAPEQQVKLAALRTVRDRPAELAALAGAPGLSTEQRAQVARILAEVQAQARETKTRIEAGALGAEAGRAQLRELLRAGRESVASSLGARAGQGGP